MRLSRVIRSGLVGVSHVRYHKRHKVCSVVVDIHAWDIMQFQVTRGTLVFPTFLCPLFPALRSPLKAKVEPSIEATLTPEGVFVILVHYRPIQESLFAVVKRVRADGAIVCGGEG